MNKTNGQTELKKSTATTIQEWREYENYTLFTFLSDFWDLFRDIAPCCNLSEWLVGSYASFVSFEQL
jgi:hypothetical protein